MISPKRSMSPLAIVLSLSAAFFVVFLILSGLFFMGRGPGSSSSDSVGTRSAKAGLSSPLFGGGSVGVLELNGVIMDSKRTLKRLEALEDDASVKAIVVRINSPGGAVAPSQEIYQAVKQSKKPLIASMGSIAASGGYYIACGAQKIYANPGTITGSIGVIMEFANLEKLYEWIRVQRFSIKTGKFKDSGAEYRQMQPEERALLQGMVDDVLLQFKQAVAEGRKLKLEQVTPLADGRIFSGSQAKTAHLVDELGTLQDAIDEAGRMAKIKGKPNVVYPAQGGRSKLLDLILDNGGSKDDSSESSIGEASSDARWARFIVGGLSALFGFAPPATESTFSGGLPGMPAPGIYWLWKGAR